MTYFVVVRNRKGSVLCKSEHVTRTAAMNALQNFKPRAATRGLLLEIQSGKEKAANRDR